MIQNDLAATFVTTRRDWQRAEVEKNLILLAHPSGVEPDKSVSKTGQNVSHAHKNAHTNCVSADNELQTVIKVWPSLPIPLKAAVLAIVRTASGRGGGRVRK